MPSTVFPKGNFWFEGFNQINIRILFNNRFLGQIYARILKKKDTWFLMISLIKKKKCFDFEYYRSHTNYYKLTTISNVFTLRTSYNINELKH